MKELGDMVETLAHPVAVAIKSGCLDEQNKLRAGSPCDRKKKWLNKFGNRLGIRSRNTMNKLATLGLVFFSLAAFGTTTNRVTVNFTLSDFIDTPSSSRHVQIIPLTADILDDPKTYKTDAAGQFTVTNMVPGLYQIDVQSPPKLATRYIAVPDTNGVTFSAYELLTTRTNMAFPPPGYAWSIAASDARYSPIGAGGLAFIPQVGSTNLTNWSKIPTNVLGSGVSSLNSSTGAVSIVGAGYVTVGTTSGVVTVTGTGGGGTTTTNASELTTGTLDAALLPSVVVTNGQTNVILQGSFTGTLAGKSTSSGVGDWAASAGYLSETLAGAPILSVTDSTNLVVASDKRLVGNGVGLTNLNGANIQAGTINSNKFDVGTSNLLALVGGGSGTATTNASDLTTGTLDLARLPGEVLSNSVPFFTVAAAGLANGLSTRSNNGAMFGPDTPGTVTCGLQEALNAIPKATNQGPLAFGGRLILQPGHFYFTNTLLFSNVWNNGLTLEGAGLFQTKLVYAGSGEGVKTVNLCGTPAALASTYPLAGHYNIRDIGFTALNNTTNVLLWITNQAYVNIENCLFTSWQLMTNQTHGAGISITDAQSNPSGLVGLHLGGDGDCASFVRNCFFNGLATGADLACDHAIVDGFRTAEIGMNTMLWPSNSFYSLGASILRRGGMDGHYRNVYFYGVKAGLVLLGAHVAHEYMNEFMEETCDYPLASDTPSPSSLKVFQFVNADGFPPAQYRVTNSPAYAFIALPLESQRFAVFNTWDGNYKGKLYSAPVAITNVVFFHNLTNIQNFDEEVINTSGATNVPFIWSATSHSFNGPNGFGLVRQEVSGFDRWLLTNATYDAENSIINVVTSPDPFIYPYGTCPTNWTDQNKMLFDIPVCFFATNWSEVDAAIFTGNGSSLTNLNASALASGTVPGGMLPGGIVTNGASFPVTFSNAVTVVGTNYVTKLRVGGASESADAINVTGICRSSAGFYGPNNCSLAGGLVAQYSAAIGWHGNMAMFGSTAGRLNLAYNNAGGSCTNVTFGYGMEGGTNAMLVHTVRFPPMLTIINNTNGPANLIVSGSLTVTNGLLISSNSFINVPTLTAGQNFYCSSNGVPHVIWSDESGTLHTNRLVE